MKIPVLLIAVLVSLPPALSIDSDNDGIPDSQDPYPFDYDNDLLPDEWEMKNGLPFDRANTKHDNDNDGLTDYDEFYYKTNPNSADTDGDGIDDIDEIKRGTSPLEKNLHIKISTVVIVLAILTLIVGTLLLYLKKTGRDRVDEAVANMEAQRNAAMLNEMRRRQIEQIKVLSQQKREGQQKAFYNNNPSNNQHV